VLSLTCITWIHQLHTETLNWRICCVPHTRSCYYLASSPSLTHSSLYRVSSFAISDHASLVQYR
jgi:hypothetical protein